jgi:ubiquinone/menaquinone biosynthesis C-methylase UbiE
MQSPLVARAYESRLWRRCRLVNLLQGISFDREYKLVVDSLDIKDRSVIVDVGCGTGLYARGIAKTHPLCRVIGVDISRAMLARAIVLRDLEGLRNVSYVESDAHQLPIMGNVADAVVCCGALHLFRDSSAVLQEMFRVLKPGGYLAVATYRHRAGWLSAQVKEIRHRLTGMSAFLPEELEAMLRRQNFLNVEHHHAKGIWLISSASKAAA